MNNPELAADILFAYEQALHGGTVGERLRAMCEVVDKLQLASNKKPPRKVVPCCPCTPTEQRHVAESGVGIIA